MELTHEFTVPASVEDTWTALCDIEGVAGCFPGATVTQADEESFTGSVKVKLGPIALVYNGSGTFTEKDAGSHRMAIDAKGKDKRGNGTAGAKVTATLADSGGRTAVTVVTDLTVTGKPAQFGRGVMQDVSDKLLGQFTDCLAQRVGQPVGETGPAAESGVAEPVPPQADSAEATVAERPAVTAATEVPRVAAATGPSRGPGASNDASHEDALDLGATVLPVLAKAYWRQALAAVVALWLLRRGWRRSR